MTIWATPEARLFANGGIIVTKDKEYISKYIDQNSDPTKSMFGSNINKRGFFILGGVPLKARLVDLRCYMKFPENLKFKFGLFGYQENNGNPKILTSPHDITKELDGQYSEYSHNLLALDEESRETVEQRLRIDQKYLKTGYALWGCIITNETESPMTMIPVINLKYVL